MTFFNFAFLKDKLPRRARVLYSPRREFIERLRVEFLEAWRAEHPAPVSAALRSGRASPIVARAAVAAAVLMAFVGGAAVYADARNVGAKNMLYPLKRAQEEVRVALAPADARPGLHLGLAERRAREIKSLEKDPAANGAAIKGLERDIGNSVSSSLSSADEADFAGSPEKMKSYCSALAGFMSDDAEEAGAAFNMNPHIKDRIGKKCGVQFGGGQVREIRAEE